MTARSTNICLQLLNQITFHIVVPRGRQGFSTEFEESFIALFRILQGLGSLQLDQSTTLTDRCWHKSISETNALQFSDIRDRDKFLFECICTFIIALAELNVRLVSPGVPRYFSNS